MALRQKSNVRKPDMWFTVWFFLSENWFYSLLDGDTRMTAWPGKEAVATVLFDVKPAQMESTSPDRYLGFCLFNGAV